MSKQHSERRGTVDPARGCDPVRDFLESLGLDTSFADEQFAPPVDRELLTVLARSPSELTPDERKMAFTLSGRFESWRRVFEEVLTKEGIRLTEEVFSGGAE